MIALVASILLAGVPLLVQAAQIAPNPNPAGSTLDIINDPFAVNNETPYSNEGTIAIDSNSTLTNSTGATLNNGGSINITDSSGTLTNVVGATLNNTGVVNYGYGTLNNAGTLNNFAGGTVSYCCITGGPLNNAGTLNNFAGATLNTINLNNTGTLNNFAGADWRTASNAPGYVVNSVGAMINNYATMDTFYTFLTNGGTLNNFGLWTAHDSDLTNSVEATFNNTGLFGYPGATQPSLTNAGIVNNGMGATLGAQVSNTGILNNAGTVTTYSFNNAGTVLNTGVIAGPQLDPTSGHFLQTAGLTINNGAMSLPQSFDIQGGILLGTGTITSPVVTLSSGAILSPGDATTLGTLTINGNLQSSGNLMFNIGGVGAGQFDVLAIHGMAFLNGGTVGFNFVNFTPVAGNSWDFLYASTLSGWETLQFDLGGLSPNLGYTFSYANGVETLRVYSVPEPDSLLLLAVGIAGLLAWQWKQRGRALS